MGRIIVNLTKTKTRALDRIADEESITRGQLVERAVKAFLEMDRIARETDGPTPRRRA